LYRHRPAHPRSCTDFLSK